MARFFYLNGVYEKFGCDDNWREESGGGVEHTEACLFTDVGNVAEIPCDEIVDLVDGGDGDVDCVGDVFAVKDAALDIAFGEDRDFLGKIELLERLDEIETAGAVRFGDAFYLTLDEYRAEYAIFRKFMLPPADR